MGKVRVTVEATQVVTYRKEIIIEEEEYKLLCNLDEVDVLNNPREFMILDGWFHPDDIYHAEQEYYVKQVALEGIALDEEDEP